MLRLLCVTGGILLIAGGISAHNAPIASGDQPLVQLTTAPENDAQTLVEAGLRLEENQQWGDAIHHYESGLRKHAGNATMQQRLLICRLHYDVVRRYQDASFLQSIKDTATHQSLELYSEMLANIETHYVDGVDWKKIARHGSASLEVALTEPSFISQLLPNVTPEAIDSFRQNVHTHVVHRDVKSRHDLRAIASIVSGLLAPQRSWNLLAVHSVRSTFIHDSLPLANWTKRFRVLKETSSVWVLSSRQRVID
jgi:carboxyl-terminal processing protease